MSSAQVLSPDASTPRARADRPAPSGWILSPTWDMLLLANVLWPIVALIAIAADFGARGMAPNGATPVVFLQVYLISAPHRLITVPMVLLDKRHMADWRRFASVAGGLTLLALGLLALGLQVPYAGTALFYLIVIDFAWNAWHFAAQHAGISRIYGRMAHPTDPIPELAREKSILRTMVLWVFLRVGMWHGLHHQGGELLQTANAIAAWMDPLFFLGPAWLVWRELGRVHQVAWGRVAYLTSVTALYASMLVGMHINTTWLVGMFVAHAVFHSVEYFAVIGWAASKKKGGGTRPRCGPWRSSPSSA